jgi:DNA-binding CsgD family transcriptional regulator
MQNDDPEMTIARLSVLTPAEQAVLDQALTGVPAREIAEHLSLSEATVRSHLSSIYVKLGVSGRVALLAHFRSADAGMPAVHAPAPPRAMAVSLCGSSWAVLALLEGAYAVYLGSGALANGGSQETWILTVGFVVLTVFGGRLARGILLGPSRRLLLVSLAAAGGHVLFAIRGLFLSGPVQPFIVLGAMAAVIILISWLAMRDMPD